MADLPALHTDFIEFMLECEVLRFGDFLTKSGRRTPYFINTGHYDSGRRLRRLGEFYARAIVEHIGTDFDVLYGPAYKGIPLAVATAAALDARHGLDVGVTFNRKQAKDHGEGGNLVGHPIRDGLRIVIIDDVVTAGTSVNESMTLLRQAAAVEVKALVVSVDRQERGSGSLSALADVAATHGIETAAIVTLDDILAYLEHSGNALGDDADLVERIRAYRAAYGA